MELRYEIIDNKDNLKEYYRKAFIHYFELLDPKNLKEANKYKPKKLLGYNKKFIEKGIKINDVSLFYTLIQFKRYSSLKLPKLSNIIKRNFTEKMLFEKVDEYYKKEYLKTKNYFKEKSKIPQNLPFYFLCFFENNIKDNFNKRIEKILSINNNLSLERLELLYGKEKAKEKLFDYTEKQKNKKCNSQNGKERAVTLKNLTQKWGEKLGTRFFNQYCKTQQYSGNNINYFIEKYGEEDGIKKFEKINKSKANTFNNFIQRYGNELGKQKWNLYLNNKKRNYSQISINLFKELENQFPNLTFYYEENEVSFYDEKNNRYYFYDCYIPEKNLIIEFNGDLFHANPKIFNENDTPNPYNKNITAKEIWEYDKMKNNFIINKGYHLIIVWEKDYKENKEKVLMNLKNLIKGIQ